MYRQHTLLSQETVCIEFEGVSMTVPAGISVAAAVMGHAQNHYCRHATISGEKRAPYCFMGVCHECLMKIDGKPYQQACMTTVENGMKIFTQAVSGDQ